MAPGQVDDRVEDVTEDRRDHRLELNRVRIHHETEPVNPIARIVEPDAALSQMDGIHTGRCPPSLVLPPAGQEVLERMLDQLVQHADKANRGRMARSTPEIGVSDCAPCPQAVCCVPREPNRRRRT